MEWFFPDSGKHLSCCLIIMLCGWKQRQDLRINFKPKRVLVYCSFWMCCTVLFLTPSHHNRGILYFPSREWQGLYLGAGWLRTAGQGTANQSGFESSVRWCPACILQTNGVPPYGGEGPYWGHTGNNYALQCSAFLGRLMFNGCSFIVTVPEL